MIKNKNIRPSKWKKTIIVFSLSMIGFSTFLTPIAQAQAISVPVPGVTSPAPADPDPSTCDNNVWQNLWAQYANKMNAELPSRYQVEYNDLQATAPAAPDNTSCIENAINQINSIISKINALISLLSGSMDWNSLLSAIENTLLNLVCKEVDNVTGTAVLNGLGPLNNNLNTATYLTNGLQTPNVQLGNTNSGGVGVTQYVNQNNGNSISYIGANGSTTTSQPSVYLPSTNNGILNQVNPFLK
jgi:hypothetical protein